jgi:glycosyltransferase 2 family protein
MKQLLRIGLCLGALLLLFHSVDTAALAGVFNNVTPGSIAYLAIITLALIYCSVLKWQLFLSVFPHCPPVRDLFELYVVGYFINSFVPSSLGGDMLRSWQVGRVTGQAEALASTFLERYTGFIAMLFLGVVVMWFSPLVSWNVCSALLAIVAATIGISIVGFSRAGLLLIRKLPLPSKVVGLLEKLNKALHIAVSNPRLIARAMILSFVFHSLTIVNTLAACWAIGWLDAPILELFVVVPLILLIGALPITPSGLGIQEGAFYFFLHGLGASPEQALGVGLVLRAKTYCLAALGGVLWARRKGTIISQTVV